MPNNVFYQEQNTLNFYTELYNLPEASVFSYYIASAETNQIVGNLLNRKFKNQIMKPGFS